MWTRSSSGERAKNQNEFCSSLDPIQCVVSAPALGDGALPATCLFEQYFTATSVPSSSRLVLHPGLGESSRAAALRAGWAGASPGREAPLGKSTSAAKWIAETILVLMRLCKPGCGSQSLTSLVAHSIPITSCSPGAFVLQLGLRRGYCSQTGGSIRNYLSLLISLPNRTCKSVLSCKWTLAHLCSCVFFHFFRIAVIFFFFSQLFMKFNPNILYSLIKRKVIIFSIILCSVTSYGLQN